MLVLAMGFSVVQLLAAAKPAPEKKQEEQRPVSLLYTTAREESVHLAVTTQGEVRAHTEIDLTAQVGGRVTAISEHFAEGASFASGQALIELDDSDYRLAMARAEAGVAQAEVLLLQAKAAAEIKRKQWLAAHPNKTPTPLQVNQPQVEEAEARLRSAKAELADAQLNLSRTRITLPFDGRVIQRSVGVGQYVTPNTVLGRVFSTDRVEIRLPLTDSQLLELELPMGFVATEESPGPQVTLSATIGTSPREWHGRIVRTQAAVDQETRLIYAIVEVNDPYGAGAHGGAPLAVGLYVTAEAESVLARQAVVLPRDALRNADKIYVIDEENRLDIRTVEVLSTSENRIVIGSGIEGGERVVTSTVANLVDGMEVQPVIQLAQK